MAELSPPRLGADEPARIREQLETCGVCVVRDALSESELHHARGLLWEFLGERGWERRMPSTWTDAAYDPGRPDTGVMGQTVHSAPHWYIRTRPGILKGFAAAYGTDDLVAAFDDMAINRPASCGEASVAELGEGPGRLNGRRLHTHFNQDRFGEDVRICCAPLHHFRGVAELTVPLQTGWRRCTT